MTERPGWPCSKEESLEFEFSLAVDRIVIDKNGDKLVLCCHTETGQKYKYNPRLDTLEPVMIIKHYPDVWWRRILGFFVPRLGPTKYGVIDLTPDGSLEIVGRIEAVDLEPVKDYGAVIDKIQGATHWQAFRNDEEWPDD